MKTEQAGEGCEMGEGEYQLSLRCPGKGWKKVATINGGHWTNTLWFKPHVPQAA